MRENKGAEMLRTIPKQNAAYGPIRLIGKLSSFCELLEGDIRQFITRGFEQNPDCFIFFTRTK
jgi:hypothetical protein